MPQTLPLKYLFRKKHLCTEEHRLSRLCEISSATFSKERDSAPSFHFTLKCNSRCISRDASLYIMLYLALALLK